MVANVFFSVIAPHEPSFILFEFRYTGNIYIAEVIYVMLIVILVRFAVHKLRTLSGNWIAINLSTVMVMSVTTEMTWAAG